MTVCEVLSMIDSIAPFSTQEEWDNSGLLVGSPAETVTGILMSLDVTEPVIREARKKNASLIITHHPLMIAPRRILTDEDMEGRIISSLIRSRISLISAHTNLDRAPGGINDSLATVCGLLQVSGEGFFRSGALPEVASVKELADKLAVRLSCTVRVMGSMDRKVRRIGVSSGSGGDFWKEAILSGCEAFITGEMKHHLALAAADAGISVLECGHHATEEPGIRALGETLQKTFNTLKYNIGVYLSEIPAYTFSQQQ